MDLVDLLLQVVQMVQLGPQIPYHPFHLYHLSDPSIQEGQVLQVDQVYLRVLVDLHHQGNQVYQAFPSLLSHLWVLEDLDLLSVQLFQDHHQIHHVQWKKQSLLAQVDQVGQEVQSGQVYLELQESHLYLRCLHDLVVLEVLGLQARLFQVLLASPAHPSNQANQDLLEVQWHQTAQADLAHLFDQEFQVLHQSPVLL